MAHYDRYTSTLTKKSREKKERAKSKSKKNNLNEIGSEFVIKQVNEDTGTVVETRYDEAIVLYKDSLFIARLKQGINTFCNKVLFPGDKVIVKKENDELIITNLIARKNILSRNKVDSTRKKQKVGDNNIIATNIDTAVIVVSAKTPPLHSKFIDRYLMVLQNSKIESIICLNKSDLKSEEEEKILEIYRKLNIPVIETSTIDNTGIEELKNILRGKQAIFVGHSGVGKSSLTNAIMDAEDIKTSSVSKKSGKGRHTTTTSKYYIWDEKSSIIDTPGIRSLDISNFELDEIKEFFSEFQVWEEKCKFSNCLHYKEPEADCFVKQAVKAGIISKERYDSYVRILSDIADEREKEDDGITK